MTIIEKAIKEIEGLYLPCDDENRIIALVEQACEDSEYEGFTAGELAGIQECRDNPFSNGSPTYGEC